MKSVITAIAFTIMSINVVQAETVSIQKDCRKTVMESPQLVNKSSMHNKDYILFVGNSSEHWSFFSVSCVKFVYNHYKEEIKTTYTNLTTKE